jgi:hypothetical protein
MEQWRLVRAPPWLILEPWRLFLRAVGTHPGAVEALPGAAEAHPGAVEALPGATEAHPGAVKALP